jgi:hypothetical protein
MSLAAGDLRSGQAELLAQHVCERTPDGRLDRVPLSVDE